ncbi:phage portal protein [Pseudochelatococcus sp. G4_1912]|uniref:phage portal protein n=1 Tax=Pseudochelatococcus sp. G4_1912 TaxID=3114288 RepID=UPI0039C6FA10
MKSNFLDRAIGWIAPEAGARRIRNRAAMDIMMRGYDGAQRSRAMHSWKTRSTSADAEIAKAASLLRDRMRDLVRNNPYAANALSVLVTHTIGDGITPRAKDPKINELFQQWCIRCDADGHLDFYGLQALVFREMLESGDGIVRRRRRQLSDGLPVPLQLQVIETDQIDSSRDGRFSGKDIIQGIEFDDIGRRRAYWMYPNHPGGAFIGLPGSLSSRPIPAEDIAHLFEKQRTQVRGVPWGSPVISSLQALAGYEEAELVRKRIEACMVGIMTGADIDDGIGISMDGPDGKPLPPGVYDANGERIEKFAPGMIYNAVGGRDVKFTQPASTGSYDAYKTSMLHTVAAGFRVPHALLSGRLDKVNYSSSKVGLEGFKLTISALQWHIVIPMLCQPVWDWFCEAAYLAGKISSPVVPVEWSPPRLYSADPNRDVTARVAEVRAGFKSLSSAISETGYNPDDVLSEIAADNAKLDALGLVFDSDPRRISQAGQTQQAQSDITQEDDQDA